MFLRNDNDDRCVHCGVYLEVLGPPGPIHDTRCPVRLKAEREERERLLRPSLTNEEASVLEWLLDRIR